MAFHLMSAGMLDQHSVMCYESQTADEQGVWEGHCVEQSIHLQYFGNVCHGKIVAGSFIHNILHH
jgi:hypothetical protein